MIICCPVKHSPHVPPVIFTRSLAPMEVHCPTCQGINVESLTQPFGYQHLSLLALRRSSEHCQVCSLFCSALEHPDTSKGVPDPNDIWQDAWSLYIRLTSGSRPQVRLVGWCDYNCVVTSEISVHSSDNDPSIKFGIRPLRCLPANTMSDASFATARSWIAECISYDKKKEVPELKAELKASWQTLDWNDWPKRLLMVQQSDSGITLKLMTTLPHAQAYTALSHCVDKALAFRDTDLLTNRFAVGCRSMAMVRLPTLSHITA